MAHQCWNDGTDRSTLPIHGSSDIGKTIAQPVTVSWREQIFFSQDSGSGKRRRNHGVLQEDGSTSITGRVTPLSRSGATVTWLHNVAAFVAGLGFEASATIKEPLFLLEAIALPHGVDVGAVAVVLVSVPDVDVASIGSPVLVERR